MADFASNFEKKVKSSIIKYKLISNNERVAVAISGGKDSTSLLYLLKKLGYNVFGIFVDLGIKGNSDENLKRIKEFSKKNELELKVVDLVKETGYSLPEICDKYQKFYESTNCAICGVIKRHYLNKAAKDSGAKLLATGHNLDDEAENLLLNIFSNNYELCAGLGPKSVDSESEFFIQRIKPLYDCLNSETKKYADLKGFDIYPETCPLRINAFRKDIRDMLKSVKSVDKLKKSLVANFYYLLKKLRADNKQLSIVKCSQCSGPARNKLCKNCEILEIMKK